MSDTKVEQKQAVPPVAPEAQPVAKVDPEKTQRKEGWENFKTELDKRADEIGSQLPANVSRERFIGAALAAVKATPGILAATPRSLFSALIKAAQDGLLPDGREGIITVYNTTVDGSKQIIAQWNPMFYGIRKRARELDGIIIDAQVVVEGDEFDYQLGDEPKIHHHPKARSEVIDASKGVAVYAIFRHPTEGILHREVMWKPEVFAVMNQSRAKDSLMWTKFWTEGWRKTVGRRGSKSVPVSPQLERLIQRDDENFDFPKSPVMISGPSKRPTPPPAPPPPDESQKPASDDAPKGDKPSDDFNQDDSGTSTPTDILSNLGNWLSMAKDAETIESTWSELDIESEFSSLPDEMAKAIALTEHHLARVGGQAEMFPGDLPFK